MHFERPFFSSSQFDSHKTRIHPCVMFVDGGVPKFGCDMSADKKWNNNTPNVGQATATITTTTTTTITNSFISIGMYVDRLPYQICR